MSFFLLILDATETAFHLVLCNALECCVVSEIYDEADVGSVYEHMKWSAHVYVACPLGHTRDFPLFVQALRRCRVPITNEIHCLDLSYTTPALANVDPRVLTPQSIYTLFHESTGGSRHLNSLDALRYLISVNHERVCQYLLQKGTYGVLAKKTDLMKIN